MIITLLLLCIATLSHQCTLQDVQKTEGDCVHIRKCPYQLANFRVGGSVARCGDHGNVCCPKKLTVAEKKCNEWREMLHAPASFGLPKLDKPVCGMSQPFITGGRNAEVFEYPHAVSLGYGPDVNKLKYLCGATLISEKFILTAAHCVTHQKLGKPTYAVIGDIILDPKMENIKPNPYRKVVKIANTYAHPDYKPPLIYNDIALLSLSTPLDLSRFVLPACLGMPLTTPKRNSQVEASGWGITDVTNQKTSNILQSINITTVDTQTCNSIYGLEPDKGFRYPEGIVKTQTCATGEDKDTCRGDSGGGLYRRELPCIFHVVGVTSIGSKVCGLGSPAVYTTVSSYVTWIESIVWG